LQFLRSHILARILLWPFSCLYLLLIETRNLFYNHHILKVTRFGVPIISVGNITSGGSGKTPMVLALIELLQHFYPRIAVVSRGYKRDSTGVQIVSDGKGWIAGCKQGGDEPVLIARKQPAFPVVVAEKRSAGIEQALRQFAPDLIILDDAFQHRSVYRQCDIVLVNAGQDLRKDFLLPVGYLREPLKNIKRADLIIWTGYEFQKEQAFTIPLIDTPPSYKSYTHCVGYVQADFIMHKDASSLKDKRVIAFCGIANPDSFKALVSSLQMHIVAFYPYKDHYRYRKADFQRLAAVCKQENGDYLITTEKDLVKWIDAGNVPANAIALTIKSTFEHEDVIRRKIQTILDMRMKND
jgi:tetraacyldisaccharide 4'-kinase